MKVLSVRQPWAWLIIHGGKNIENRTWSTKFRGRFLVHASKQLDLAALDHLKRTRAIWFPDHFEYGGVIGSVELVDCVQADSDAAHSRWFEGPWGFVLKDPQPLDFHPMKGRLGFFNEQ